jgi:multidrug transporter EmrE-like cation transporter
VKWIILSLGIAANSSASIPVTVTVTVALTPPRRLPKLSDLSGSPTNWPFYLGLAFYGAALSLHAAALTHPPLNVAQPALTSGAAAVAAISILALRESFRWTAGAEISPVPAGMALITARVA